MSAKDMGATTSIAASTTDEIVVRGKSLTRELMGHVDFTAMICFHLSGRMPTPGEKAVVNSVLVALMEHGMTPSSIAARLIHTASPEAMQAAVATGLLGAGSQFLGTTEAAARVLQDGVSSDLPPFTYAERIVQEHLAAGRVLPGFGHHIHRPDDPRAPRLLAIADENGVSGPHAAMLRAISRELDRAKRRHVTVNATGAVAAVLSDLGYPWHAMRGFSLIARAAGVVGHVLEESENPLGRELWQLADNEVRYVGDWPDESAAG